VSRPANPERAERAEQALQPYGVRLDPFDAVVACLCDLRHYCAASGIGFDAQLRTADEHYQLDWKGWLMKIVITTLAAAVLAAPTVFIAVVWFYNAFVAVDW
jgi:hypothetical protein